MRWHPDREAKAATRLCPPRWGDSPCEVQQRWRLTRQMHLPRLRRRQASRTTLALVRHCGSGAGRRVAPRRRRNDVLGSSPTTWRRWPRMAWAHRGRSGSAVAVLRAPACRQWIRGCRQRMAPCPPPFRTTRCPMNTDRCVGRAERPAPARVRSRWRCPSRDQPG